MGFLDSQKEKAPSINTDKLSGLICLHGIKKLFYFEAQQAAEYLYLNLLPFSILSFSFK